MAEKSTSEFAFEHAWRYFQLHAAQRIAVFNFFFILSGAIAAGIGASLQASQKLAAAGIVLGGLLVLASFIFWKLDQRVSALIKLSEKALAEFEHSLPITCARIFQLNDAATSSRNRPLKHFIREIWTYGESFRVIFGVMAVAGATGAVLSSLKVAGLFN
jgi:hypothetical protein